MPARGWCAMSGARAPRAGDVDAGADRFVVEAWLPVDAEVGSRRPSGAGRRPGVSSTKASILEGAQMVHRTGQNGPSRERSRRTGRTPNPGQRTLDGRDGVRETTWVSYRMAVDRITRQIGAVQIQSLTPLQVEGLYATLLERGGAGGRPLAPKTVRNCHIVLRRALADAERLGLVARNTAAAAKAVSAPRGEQRTWSSEGSSGSSTRWRGSGCRWRSCC